jgi:outer membrane protein
MKITRQLFLKQFLVFLVLAFLCIAFLTGNAYGQNDTSANSLLNLKGCVELAIKNNLLVQQNDIKMQSAAVARLQAMGYLFPLISAGANQGDNFGKSINPTTYTYINQEQNVGSYYVSGSLTLFSGLQVQNGIRQTQFAYEASKMDLQQQKDVISINVLNAYLQILTAQDLLNISREQADVDLKQVNRLDRQNQEGALLLLSDLYNLKGAYSGDLANIATAVNNLETAKVGLYQLMNVPYNRNAQFERILTDLQAEDTLLNADAIFQEALKIIPAIKSADLNIRSYQKALAATRGQYYPVLSLYGSVSSNYSNLATNTIFGAVSNQPTSSFVTINGTQYPVIAPNQSETSQQASFGSQFNNNMYTQIGISLNIPILNYFKARNNVKQAKINLQNSEYTAHSARMTLQQNVELAYQNMIAAYKQYKAYIDQVAAYTESFRTTEIRFNEGVINSDPYVIAKNNLDRASISLAQAKYIYILRIKVLDYYQGRLSW